MTAQVRGEAKAAPTASPESATPALASAKRGTTR